MKKDVFILVVCVMLYTWSAIADLETVWLKDITTRFETDKRTLSDPDLPDELTFQLSRGSDALTLNLKRNHGIDPNADIYVVRKLKNGQTRLEKTRNLEKEAVAYYQDRENGAFMTVKCIKRSDGQCDRGIHGNIRIGDKNYNLRPAETDDTSTNLFDVPDLLGKRYLLHEQANIQRDMSIKINTDAANVNEKNVEQTRIDFLRRVPHEDDRRNHFSLKSNPLSSRNVTGLHNRGTIDKKDNVKQVYWVDVAVLIDSTIWDFHSSLLDTNHALQEDILVKRKIREAYSHVINGVNLLYNGIEDSSIEINVSLREFYIFQSQHVFPHVLSSVKIRHGESSINMDKYVRNIAYWDTKLGSKYGIDYDHAMLFTRYVLYDPNDKNGGAAGYCIKIGGICDTGERVSVVNAKEDFFFWTVSTAAHELGHSLGAVHDGFMEAISCPAEDLFIMSYDELLFTAGDPYSRNHWMFSNCSVEAFKKTLKSKTCVKNKGVSFNETEWTEYVTKLLGEVYTLNEQCELIYGPKSVFCGTVTSDVCLFMECTDPNTGQCMWDYARAARGTRCGENMWCIEGRCVSKVSKQE